MKKTKLLSMVLLCALLLCACGESRNKSLSVPESAGTDELLALLGDAISDGRETLALRVSAEKAAELPPERLKELYIAAVCNDAADLPIYPTEYRSELTRNTDGSYDLRLSMRYESVTDREYDRCREAYTSALRQYQAELCALSEPPEKLYRTIYFLICRHTSYDEKLGELTLRHDPESVRGEQLMRRGAYGALIEGKSICTGYAMLYKALCDSVDLPCRVVIGETESGLHAWNVVLLDGELRYVDASEGDRGAKTDDSYCLMREVRYQGLNRAAEKNVLPSAFAEKME